MKTVRIASFRGGLNAEARAALVEADVVIGVDEQSQREFTVFGTPSLESTTTLKKPSAMRVVQVPIDAQAGDLEELTALVSEIKSLRPPRTTK